MRAVAIKNRTLIYHCIDCRSAHDYTTNQSGPGDTLLDGMKLEFSLLAESLTARLGDEVQKQIRSIFDEIAILKQTNSDLLGLCAPLKQWTSTTGSLFRSSAAHTSSEDGNPGRTPRRQASVSQTETRAPPSAHVSRTQRPKSPAEGTTRGGSLTTSNPAGSPDQAQALVSAGSSTGRRASSAGGSGKQALRATVLGTRRMTGARIAAANIQKKTSILVGRLGLHVTADDLKDYMKATFGDAECFLVEEQKVRSGDYRSFRVEGPLDLLDGLLCSSNWPEGVLVKKFRFFRVKTSGSQ